MLLRSLIRFRINQILQPVRAASSSVLAGSYAKAIGNNRINKQFLPTLEINLFNSVRCYGKKKGNKSNPNVRKKLNNYI